MFSYFRSITWLLFGIFCYCNVLLSLWLLHHLFQDYVSFCWYNLCKMLVPRESSNTLWMRHCVLMQTDGHPGLGSRIAFVFFSELYEPLKWFFWGPVKVVLEARFQPIHLLVTNSFICTFKPRLLFLLFSVIKKKIKKKTQTHLLMCLGWRSDHIY